MLIFGIFKNGSSTFKCYISKSKSVVSECNDLYFIVIAFIAFTLHEIKQCPVFWDIRQTAGGDEFFVVVFSVRINLKIISASDHSKMICGFLRQGLKV
jgi:hypothetical protein